MADMDKNKNELDIEALSRLVDSTEPDGEISIDAILAEYRESSKAAPAGQVRSAPYMPENDRELSKEIASVVNAVLDEGQQRRSNARKYEEQTKRQNRRTEHYETLANTAAVRAKTVTSERERKKLEKVARRAAQKEEKLRRQRRRQEEKKGLPEDTLGTPAPVRRSGTVKSAGDTIRLPVGDTLRTMEGRAGKTAAEAVKTAKRPGAEPEKEPEKRRAALREELQRELPVRTPEKPGTAAAGQSREEEVPKPGTARVIDLQQERSRRNGKEPEPAAVRPVQEVQRRRPRPEKKRKARSGPKPGTEERRREPTIPQALKSAREAKTFMGTRALAAWVISVALIYMTAAGELGLPMFRLADRAFLAAAFALNVLVTLLCSDVLLYGISELVALRPGSMCLMMVADILTLANSIVGLVSRTPGGLEPMNAVCAVVLTAALTAERRKRRAMVTLYKAASGVSTPYVVTAEPAERFGRSALVKTETPPEGFVTLSRMPDKCTRIMRVIAPGLLVLCPALAAVAVLAGACQAGFFAAWGALAAAAIPLSVGAASSLPLKYVTEKLAKSGCAVAGFGGAERIAGQKRVVITDRDVFPPGCVGFNGMKIVDSRSTEKIISVTASLIRASGSDLTRLFTELMNEQMGQWREIEDFEFLDGGFGGIVDGEYAMCGNAEFMRMRGIELPKGLRAKNAVFTAFGTRLAGVFALNYMAAPAAEEALNTLLYNGSQPYLASTDFNVTPACLETRFRLDHGKMATPEKGVITEDARGTPPAAAVICREGLTLYADTVTGGRKLAAAVRTNTIYVLLSLLIGLLLCAGLMFLGAERVLTQGKLVIYMVAWLVPVWLTSLGAKRY